MWCMLAAPLIAGNDIRKMNRETLEILTNKEVIAVDQDSLGIQGLKYKTYGNIEIWIKPLVKNQLAVCFLNRGENAREINFDWLANTIADDISKTNYDFNKNEYIIRDLWLKKETDTTREPLKTIVGGHDVVMVKLTPIP